MDHLQEMRHIIVRCIKKICQWFLPQFTLPRQNLSQMKNGTISVYWQANESGTMRNLKYSIKLGGTCSSFRVMSNSINVIVFVIYNTVFVFKKYYTLLTTLF